MPRANRDIERILLHSLDTWGEHQQNAYRAAIERAFQDLIEFPEMGRARDDLGAGYRARRVEQLVVYDRVEADSIWVVRILHIRRDVRRELLE
jgi:plasmid stabilization system protein ParE